MVVMDQGDMVIQLGPLCKCKKGHCLISIIHIIYI